MNLFLESDQQMQFNLGRADLHKEISKEKVTAIINTFDTDIWKPCFIGILLETFEQTHFNVYLVIPAFKAEVVWKCKLAEEKKNKNSKETSSNSKAYSFNNFL